MFPPWLDIAMNDLGIKEIPGADHTQRILEYHNNTTLKATTDEVAWCSAACSTWFEESGVISARSARALDWLKWGQELKEPKIGCVVVMSRDIDKGHVGLYLGRTKDQIIIIGGNQADSVSVSVFPSSRLKSYRWPA
jgi:uncharacterized protein (TIGR02594 family)